MLANEDAFWKVCVAKFVYYQCLSLHCVIQCLLLIILVSIKVQNCSILFAFHSACVKHFLCN